VDEISHAIEHADFRRTQSNGTQRAKL
jgi:hypothetical protein